MKTLKTALVATAMLATAAPAFAQYQPTQQYQRDMRNYEQEQREYQATRAEYDRALAEYDAKRERYERDRARYDARYGCPGTGTAATSRARRRCTARPDARRRNCRCA